MNLRFSRSVFLLSSHWVRTFLINLSIVFLFLKQPCFFTSNILAPQYTKAWPATLDSPDPQWFNLRQLGTTTLDKSATGHFMASVIKPKNNSLKAQAWDWFFSLVSTRLKGFSSIHFPIFLFVFIICFKSFFIDNIYIMVFWFFLIFFIKF